MNGLLLAVYWVNKGDSAKQDTFWGDSLDAHLNGWLLVATLIAYHGGMAFVLHKADCPGLSFGQSTKKVAFNQLSTQCIINLSSKHLQLIWFFIAGSTNGVSRC